MKSDVLRDKFLDFFKAKKHKIVESDSLAPKDDPTVLFTPAGMNQFKRQFLGDLSCGFSRAATAQRCLRTDDLDKVGQATSHHTFFEMLGNFSFGGYFKNEAITWAWEFLTEELKIKPEKLWVSVYKDDGEAYSIWKDKIKIPAHKIIKLGDKENFWPSEAKEKGPNGPCGPCSEIFFDQGKERGCGRPDCNPACSCEGRFVEVWNLVFTQFNRKEAGTLEPLPRKNIDTGMGLERLAAVMQGVDNNFETDIFKPVIKELLLNAKSRPSDNRLIYAVSDHIRAIVFAIYDGVLPANESQGYVLRKLIRKSILHLKSLGISAPFLYKLVPIISEIMKKPYPQLEKRRENIAQIILAEEKNFISTLDSSDALLEDKFRVCLNNPDLSRAGIIAFQLYDTYGIPLELTKDWLDKHSVKFSQEAFDKELEKQKNRSKSQSKMKGDVFASDDIGLKIKETKFLGYKNHALKVKIVKIVKDGCEVKKVTKGDNAKIILGKTIFYPESGGQVGDTGELLKGKNIFEVSDTQKSTRIIVHIGRVKAGKFSKGDLVQAKIDFQRRLSVARNHTATHLLQAALRKVLGSHVQQQGSLVAEKRLRFDFTHFKDISKNELSRIEEVVNDYILGDYPLKIEQKTLDAAKKDGALAFFGEKYEEKVRMVGIADISLELCGGTHLAHTGEIGIFKVIHEGSVAAGIRRIEAITGTQAYKKIKEDENIILNISQALSVPAENTVREIEKKLSRIKELEKQLTLQKLESAQNSVDTLISNAKEIGTVKLITSVNTDLDINLLRRSVDLIKQKIKNAVIALGASGDGKGLLVMGLTDDLCDKGLDAAKIINEVASVIGGSGGGRKNFAQAGGNKPENFPRAFEKLKEILSNLK